jgi:hypothetical protein
MASRNKELAIREEFLVNSPFQFIKIPMVDMKVHVYSKFSKNKIWKKVESPSSMKDERFHHSKCMGKVHKIGKKLSKGFSRSSLFLLTTFLD